MVSLFTGLFSFLKCLVFYALGAILAGLVGICNLLIAGLMALLGPLLALLAAVSPDLGSVSVPDFVANLGWFFPLGFFVALTGALLAFELVYPALRIVLKWLKGV